MNLYNLFLGSKKIPCKHCGKPIHLTENILCHPPQFCSVLCSALDRKGHPKGYAPTKNTFTKVFTLADKRLMMRLYARNFRRLFRTVGTRRHDYYVKQERELYRWDSLITGHLYR